MSNYIDYDEEQFYYLDEDKPKQQYNGAAEAIGDAGENIVYGIFKFLIRADLVSSGLVTLVAYLLTYKKEWPWYVYLIGCAVIFAVSFILQYASIVFRILYSIFACAAISILAVTIIGYDTPAQMHKILAISFGISALWAIVSWKFAIKLE